MNAIKDMLVGLSGFQEGKEGFALHLEMAEKCVKYFQDHRLLDIGSLEQVMVPLATYSRDTNERRHYRPALTKITRNHETLQIKLSGCLTMTMLTNTTVFD